MTAYIARRLLVTIALALATTVMMFIVTHIIPSDPAVAMLSDKASQTSVEAFRRRWGLDRSLSQQYLIYMKNLLHGDLGISIRSGRPVAIDIAEYLPATVELALAAMSFSMISGILLGVFAALTRGSWADGVIRLTSLAGVSSPVFWTGVLLIFVFFFQLGWLPSGGRLNPLSREPNSITGLYTLDALITGNLPVFVDSIKHLILPALSLGMYYMALFVRLARSGFLEEFQKDYVRTARAKGLTTLRLLFRHTLKNVAIPLLSYGGVVFGGLLSGAVVTETIFSWPGLGRYAFENALALDFPAIMGVTLVVGILYVGVNMLVDLLQAFVDPRLRDTVG